MRVKSNRVFDILDFASKELEAIYAKEEINSLMATVFSYYMKWDKPSLFANREKTVNESDLLKVYFAIKDLRNNKPIQYICNETEFSGIPLYLDENTLIPRPETEELVELISQNILTEDPEILDIGTGSGAIAVTLAKRFSQAKVSACDISEKALEVAQKNAVLNGVAITFFEFNILSSMNSQENAQFSLAEKYDVIISNPPYVCESEKSLMRKNVLDYEPHSALFVKDSEPLIFYTAIFKFAQERLSVDGTICFEINERFGNEMLNLAHEMGFSANLFQDINGKDRFIIARRSR